MPRLAHNVPTSVKRQYFELIRAGHKGADATRRVGVSTSCGSLWFIDAGSVIVPEPATISPRFLTQDDRVAIADGLHAKSPVKTIAVSIDKTFQTVDREIRRNSKPDGTFSAGGPTPVPWCAASAPGQTASRAAPSAEGLTAPAWIALAPSTRCALPLTSSA